MIDGNPLVLIASVSLHEGRLVQRALGTNGWTLLRVEDAAEAARRLDGGARRAVLVIDAGLLEAGHDAQWRSLRSQRPELGTVVRCLGPRPGTPRRAAGGTLEVHPDDADGICEAIQSLCEPGPLESVTRSRRSDILA
jgi:hypothetical protein